MIAENCARSEGSTAYQKLAPFCFYFPLLGPSLSGGLWEGLQDIVSRGSSSNLC